MTNLLIPYPVIKVYHLEYDINNRFNYDETMYFKLCTKLGMYIFYNPFWLTVYKVINSKHSMTPVVVWLSFKRISLG